MEVSASATITTARMRGERGKEMKASAIIEMIEANGDQKR